MDSLVIPSFIAGLLTFLAPCTLPLVPAYLAFVGGVALKDAGAARAKVFVNGLAFVAGFSVVFVALGLFAGSVGGLLAEWRPWLSRIGGAVAIVFGLSMIGALKIPFLMAERGPRLSAKSERRGTYGFSLLLGAAFGAGWTPCIGPVLGTVLILAGASATAAKGAALLGAFSVGLAVPFLLAALALGKAQSLLDRYAQRLGFLQKAGGALLIALGLLLVTDSMYALAPIGYRLLDFIDYDDLLKYL